jgi:RecA/RadA recombinase
MIINFINMAKIKEKFETSRVGSILDKISKSVPILVERDIKEKKFISTGVYLVDAALSARMLGGGIATNRITAFAGESGSGKSFLCFSVAKNAQKMGYEIVYIDTEQAIDREDLPNYGIDISPGKFELIRSNKVEDINITITQLLDELKEDKKSGKEFKVMIVIDSLAHMASNKEKEDLLKGDIKQDMTKAKALGSLFRSITSDLGYLDIPLLVANHTYLTMDMFPQEKLKGGNALLYSSSVIGFMTKSKLKTGEEDDMDIGQSGITVLFKTQKSRLARPKKIKFDISFIHGMNPYTGLDAFCRPEYYDKVGIAKGKEEIDKSTGELRFVGGGNNWYVRHLGKTVPRKKLFTAEVFTAEVLNNLAPIVNDYFRFKSMDEIEEANKKFNDIMEIEEDETNGFLDSADADDIFS